jgi:hypothetical protein
VRIAIRSEHALLGPLTQLHLGRAYVEGEIDIEGGLSALLDIRDRIGGGLALRQKLRFVSELLLCSPRWVNARSVRQHYSYGDDFYLAFIERRYRLYSHCLFRREEETREEAAEHKLDSMWKALGLKPGMRLLAPPRAVHRLPAMNAVSRRQVLRRPAAAGALMIGFDVSARGWATAADRAGQLARGFRCSTACSHRHRRDGGGCRGLRSHGVPASAQCSQAAMQNLRRLTDSVGAMMSGWLFEWTRGFDG